MAKADKFKDFQDFEVTRTPVDSIPMPKDGKPLDRRTDGGKGDAVRPFNRALYEANYDRIFRKGK